MKHIVVIGGGTGTTAVLSGLKQFKEYKLTVIVSMTDDGGSNAVIRDQFGLLPLSDLRKSIIALSDADQQLLREIFTYRFDKGKGLRGHTLGNLIMMGLSHIKGSEEKAVEAASRLFQITGHVIPVTVKQTNLVATYQDGVVVKGEHIIDEDETNNNGKIAHLSIDPQVQENTKAIEAIKQADIIIAGPGDLYTSTIANIIVGDVADAIANSDAYFIFINNLMTKKGQTHWMKDVDLIDEISKYAKRKPDVTLMHEGEFSKEVIDHYAKKNEHPIATSQDTKGYNIVKKDLSSHQIMKQHSGDDLVRSLVRHDAKKLGDTLHQMISQL